MNIHQLTKLNKKQASVIPALVSGTLTALDKEEPSKITLPVLNTLTTGAGAFTSGEAAKALAVAAKKPQYALAAKLIANLIGGAGTHAALRSVQKSASIKKANKLTALFRNIKSMPGKAWNKTKLNTQDTITALSQNLGLKKDAIKALRAERQAAGLPGYIYEPRMNKGNRNIAALFAAGVPVLGVSNALKDNRINDLEREIEGLKTFKPKASSLDSIRNMLNISK